MKQSVANLVSPFVDDGVADDVGDDPDLTDPHGDSQPDVVDLDQARGLVLDQGVAELMEQLLGLVAAAGVSPAATPAAAGAEHSDFFLCFCRS